jgi:uncharacterized protein (DUF1810 family)
MSDPYNLHRFMAAQAQTYDGAIGELRRGRKTGHWIWYIFPQLAGLGRSGNSQFYGITSLAEARAYLDHPVLGPRLRACVEAVNRHEGRTAREIFGEIDALKFRSSMTLFAEAAPSESLFSNALNKYYDRVRDPLTLGELDNE